MMLEEDPALIQSEVEAILTTTALPITPSSMEVFDLYDPTGVFNPGFYTYAWDDDATGAGLVQADEALAALSP
jgi:hypothetical protein